MRLRGKAVVVTGGGSGIGRQLVLGLLERGARVSACDVRSEGLAETAQLADAGDRLHTVVADVTDREAIHALPGQVVAAHGAVDGYISNAGIIQPFVRLNELEYEWIDRVIAVNLFGTINMAKAFLPHLLERPEAHVVNVASMGAFLPVPGQTVYGAAKAGVKLLTEGMYAELLETKVAVTLVMPGAVVTNITEHSGVEVPIDPDSPEAASYAAMDASDAAAVILDGMEKNRYHVLVGRDARTMSILSRLSPRRSTHMIHKQMKDLLGA